MPAPPHRVIAFVAALVAALWLALVAPGVAASDWSYAPLSAEQIATLRQAIAEMKANPRGPYLRIRWFCEDGTVLPPGPSACREHGGGHQHAELRPEIARLGEWGFHFGTILQALSYESFADLPNSGYRIRELVLQDFLDEADDGWVLRRARYYRGARQAEDEETRGHELLVRRLDDTRWRQANPLLATLMVSAVPHGQEGAPGQRMRALAQQIAEADPGFESLRVKLHSLPGPDDLPAVREYLRRRGAQLAPQTRERLGELVAALEAAYRVGPDTDRWSELARRLGTGPLEETVRAMPARLAAATTRERIGELSGLLHDGRELLEQDLGADGGRAALAILDTILYADALLFAEAGVWLSGSPTASRLELLAVAADLIDAARGSGWLTGREHRALGSALQRLRVTGAQLNKAEYAQSVRYLAGAADWAAAALQQAFDPVIERYAAAEPLALRFRDDAIRGSTLLPFSTLMEDLVVDAARDLDMAHTLFSREVHAGVIALNAGLAIGPLRFLEAGEDPASVEPDAVYVVPATPPDMGRVAGILTLDQGSRVSHVQLLARGLGIPNASIDSSLLPLLRQHAGEEVVYAVSSMGSVVLAVRETTAATSGSGPERADEASGDALTLDTHRLDLETRGVLALADVDVQDSGRIVGPKAANLGRLHRLFPDRVAAGLVIPFGVFRAHVDRDLDGDGRTLYEEIEEIFRVERQERGAGNAAVDIQEQVYRSLEAVHRKIGAMPLLPAFREELERMLQERLGAPGSYGVFVRSDTNAEDLPNFSGAGLNLTVMNVIGSEAILQAIRDVWASPFTRRAYQWRQRLITNPESVYPSVLLLESVPSDASGVLITSDVTGITTTFEGLRPDATWTVALARGVGGVVGGEEAETVLLPARGDSGREPILVSSARSPWQNLLDPSGGGMVRRPALDDAALLTEPRIQDLRTVIGEIVAAYPRPRGESGEEQPWDIELGFVDDRTVLFQIRPFVGSRTTMTLEATERLDRRILDTRGQRADLSRQVAVGESAE